MRREQLLSVVAQLPRCLIGLEACSGAHEWARQFGALGHSVRLMAPKFVIPYRKSGKNAFAVFDRQRSDHGCGNTIEGAVMSTITRSLLASMFCLVVFSHSAAAQSPRIRPSTVPANAVEIAPDVYLVSGLDFCGAVVRDNNSRVTLLCQHDNR